MGTARINSQSSEDTQVEYISQKYTRINTLLENTLSENLPSENTFSENTLSESTLSENIVVM